MMNASEVANALFVAWETGNVEGAAGLLADDFRLTGPAPVPLDKRAFLSFQQVHNEAFADWKFNPQEAGKEGDQVRFHIQITATHTGAYDVGKLGLPVPPVLATGKRRQWPAELFTFTVNDGRIASLHVDTQPGSGVLGTLEWLGVVLPAPSAPSPREMGRRWAELWNAGADLAVIDELVAPDFVSHGAPPGLPAGREGVRQWVGIFHRAFPDLYSTVEDLIVEGDKVVERFSAGGTQRGDFFGIPPSGKKATTTGINILRIADGQVVEHWGNGDDLGFMQQLGVIPSMG